MTHNQDDKNTAPSKVDIMAYVDGELGASDMKRVEAARDRDPIIKVELARQFALKAEIDQAFAHALETPMPEKILNMLREGADSQQGNNQPSAADNVLTFRSPPTTPQQRFIKPTSFFARMGSRAIPVAVAASFFVAIIFSAGIFNQSSPNASRAPNIRIVNALDSLSGNGIINISDNYVNNDGQLCRTYVDDGQQQLACRDDRAWRVVAKAPAPTDIPADAYRPAGEEEPNVIDRATQNMLKINDDQLLKLLAQKKEKFFGIK